MPYSDSSTIVSANHQFIVARLSSLDWEGVKKHDACPFDELTRLIRSFAPEIGVGAKARSHEHGLLSRSQNASQNSLLYVSSLSPRFKQKH